MRYALRSLIRAPIFTIVAIVTLALGIGANTAVFTVADPLLVRQLPVARPHELVLFRTLGSPAWRDADAVVPYALFEDLRASSDAFSHVLIASQPHRLRLRRDGQRELGPLVWTVQVSGSYFETLGVDAALGRTIDDDDDHPGASVAVVISEAFWRRHYGADPRVIGQPIRLDEVGPLSFFGRDGLLATIVGVAPPRFTGLDLDVSLDVWVAMRPAAHARVANLSGTPNPLGGVYQTVARLSRGVAVEHAQRAIDQITARVFDRLVSEGNLGFAAVAAASPRIRVESSARGVSAARARFRPWMIALITAVGVVLLVACVNVASLMLARGTARHRELAVRLSIGAGRLALLRLVIAESVILAAAGASLGLLVAYWGRLAVSGMLPPHLARLAIDGLDGRVLGFTAVVALASVVLASVVPAFWISRLELGRLLKEPDQSARAGTSHKIVLSVQVALALVLLVGAGLLLQTVWNLQAVPTGFDQDRVMQLAIDARDDLRGQLAGTGLGPPAAALIEHLETVPGLESMALYRTPQPLLEGGAGGSTTVHEAGDSSELGTRTARRLGVGPGFFETLGISVVAGRAFTPGDTFRDAIVVISVSLARLVFGGSDAAVDRSLVVGGLERRVIGVVEDVPRFSLRDPDLSTVYDFTTADFLAEPGLRLLLRLDGRAALAVPAVQERLGEFSGYFEVTDIRTLREITDASMAIERTAAVLVGSLALLAVFLVSIGVFGVISYTVAQRQKEIAVRMAIGARAAHVVRMVVREVLWVVAVGLAFGVIVALAASHLIAGLLFGVTSADPKTVAFGALVLNVAAGLAACVPALRAARRIDPMVALKE